METLNKRCAGLDVHKKIISVCVRIRDGTEQWEKISTFGTMTCQIEDLRNWLKESGVTHVAMESTGVYWHPVWNILEDDFIVLLVNAQHIKNVPGRKTDVKDCQWIAQLLQHGLLTSSYVPPISQREVRELTRSRTTLVQDRSRIVNRIQKVLEGANIKLASVVSDITGRSGMAILHALVNGEVDPEKLSNLSRGRLRSKMEEMIKAMEGRLSDHHRFLLRQLLEHYDFFNAQIEALENRIEVLMRPFQAEIERLMTLPMGKRISYHSIIAEIGVDMSRFPTSGHLAKWSGMCPGNHESAGKRKTGRTTHGNRWLKRALNQLAWSASHTNSTYFKSYYHRIAARRGKKRAIVALGHSILVIIWHILKDKTLYFELGEDYFEKNKSEHTIKRLVKRLEKLGQIVTVKPITDLA